MYVITNDQMDSLDFGSLLQSVFIIISSILVARIVYVLLRHFLDERYSELRQSKLVSRSAEYLIIAAGLLIVLLTSTDLTTLIASLGLVSLAVAFASQQVIQNFISGLLIVLQKPIKMSEWIEYSDTGLCQVKDINMTNTLLRGSDGRIFVVPNSLLIGSKIVNYTRSAIVQVTLKLEISFTSDYELIKALILDIARRNKYILPMIPEEDLSVIQKIMALPHMKRMREYSEDMNDLEPSVLITSITTESIHLDVHIWIHDIARRDSISSDMMEALLKGLKDMGLDAKQEDSK